MNLRGNTPPLLFFASSFLIKDKNMTANNNKKYMSKTYDVAFNLILTYKVITFISQKNKMA